MLSETRGVALVAGPAGPWSAVGIEGAWWLLAGGFLSAASNS